MKILSDFFNLMLILPSLTLILAFTITLTLTLIGYPNPYNFNKFLLKKSIIIYKYEKFMENYHETERYF